jgi:alkylation response protein AidB-like acyl-CoA dehydrogenase
VENLLGKEGQGWQITIGALANERSGISEIAGLWRELDLLKELARSSLRNGRPALEDARVRRRLAEFETRIAAMRFNGLRYLTKQIRGEPLGSETSVNKLHTAHLEKTWSCKGATDPSPRARPRPSSEADGRRRPWAGARR